jgi:hypothetical protein
MVNIEELLDRIIADSTLHARWLNTLSFLEHVGTRKIHKTQSHPQMTDLILKHASEEARHAHFFKKMAESIGGGVVENYNYTSMLGGYPAYRYFQSLDSMVEKKIQSEENTNKPSPFLCYLYVTTLIEERAGWLYPIYDKRLQSAKSQITLASVIQEEERHLTDMYDALKKADPIKWRERLDYFLSEEQKHYSRVFEKVSSIVTASE